MPTRLDPLEYLERNDKWYLAGGHGAMFAPAFPRSLKEFGFWDESHYVDIRIERLFTVLMLGEDARPLSLRFESRRWTPDALTQTHTTSDGLRIREDKVVTANDTLASRITVFNDGKRTRTLDLILWSLQARAPRIAGAASESAEEFIQTGDFATFAHTVTYGDTPYADRPADAGNWGERSGTLPYREPVHRLFVALGADQPPVSSCVVVAEKADTSPLWQLSPIPERFVDGKLHGSKQAIATTESDHLHICLHYRVELAPGETRTIQFGAALNLDKNRALLHLLNDLHRNVASASRESWREWFAGVPYFECSDPHLQKYYWYRWYGLRLLTVDVGGHRVEGEEGVRFARPCILEGIGGFRTHISYSAQCHAREAIWRHDPTLAFGCMEGLFDAQEHNGYLPGHLYLWRPTRGFYHADWGEAALRLYYVTRDRSFVERIYPGLARYAEYFERDRDREDVNLFDVVDQGETGQEYTSRYLFADELADDWRRIQLKGVDSTVYVYRIQRALAIMAALLAMPTEASVWNRKADSTRSAIQENMWNSDSQFFYDVDPHSGGQSPYRSVVGFYPFMDDIAGLEHLSAIPMHFLNPKEFQTPFAVPTSPVRDPYFCADAEWKGRRMSCPWNGRVWPMTNSHMADALSNASRTLDESLKPVAADFITQSIKLMFFDGSPERPNCFEHYNPFTGEPSAYRGIDDYQHSWVIDLIMRHLIGIQPEDSNTLTLDPLPFKVDRFAMSGIAYRGHTIDVEWDMKTGFIVTVDSVERHRSDQREPVKVTLG